LPLYLINYALCHEDVLRSGSIAPTILTYTLGGGERSASWPGIFTLVEGYPMSIRYEADWAPYPVWKLWQREKYSVSARKQTPVVQTIVHI
jgi:hypothetical protein